MAIYLGVGNTSHNVKEMYVGVNNSPRKVKQVYVGNSSGTPQCIYQSVPDFSIINQLCKFSIMGTTGSIGSEASVTPPLSLVGRDGFEPDTFRLMHVNYRIHGVNCMNYRRLRIHMYSYFSAIDPSKTPSYNMLVATMPTTSSKAFIKDAGLDNFVYNELTSSSYIEHRWVKPAYNEATFTIDTTVSLSSTIISNGLDLYITLTNSAGDYAYANLEIYDISLLG